MTTLEIHTLRSFDALVAFSGVRRAADVLGMAPATISGHVRKLERELGCSLVMRYGRGITLTGDGEALAEHARAVLQHHDEAVEALRPASDHELVVAATEYAAESMIPVLVSALSRAMPDVAVRLRLTRSAKASELLHRTRADLALTLTTRPPGGHRVADVPVEWVGAEAANERIVLFETPCALSELALAAVLDRPHEVVAEYNNLASVLAAVRKGEGVAVLPRFGQRADGIDPRPEMPKLQQTPLYLAASERVPDAVRRHLVDALRRTLAGIELGGGRTTPAA